MIDLDGTLVDSIPDLAAAANGMLRELGYREVVPEQTAMQRVLASRT